MNRCLNERALLDVAIGEGTAAQHAHLRLCADCAERHDAFSEDLQVIGDALVQAPGRLPDLAAHSGQRQRFMRKSAPANPLVRWVPIAAAATVLLAVGLTLTLQRAPSAIQVSSHSGNVPAFAADVSEALFADGDDTDNGQMGSDAPYLQAALEGDLPCTQERFYNGECDDQVLALVLDND